MNNSYVMSATLEAQFRSRAGMITAAFAAAFIVMMFLLKWKLPVFEKYAEDPGIEVELNLPPEEEVPVAAAGGGGGGNPVAAAGDPGVAPHVPPQPGEEEDSRDIETDDNDKAAPEVVKPINPKPEAKKVVENTSTVKTTPKPVIENPAPRVPKGVIPQGKTLTGTGKGGGSLDYDRSGGAGTGSGVGTGSGSGGGNGTGSGGGNGGGRGSGSGPKVTGDRYITQHYAFEGNLDKATVYAEVRVSPDGIGQFASFLKGSTTTASGYKNEIISYLRNIRFNKSDHESVVTVQFIFKVN